MKKNKILITGAFGFVGSHLTEYFIENGYDVIAFDRYNNFNNYGWLEYSKYKKSIEFILGDIRDYDSVSKALKKSSSCLHLAALIGIPYSYYSPLAYLKTNVEGTYNILESSKNLTMDQVIITSTSETYGSAQYTPMDENHPLVGQSPYSASKIAADQLALSYYKSFDTPIKIIRPFNVYGPRQSLRAVIPTIISQLNKSNVVKLGNLDAYRDYTFILDLCTAYKSIMKKNYFFGKVVNVGSGKCDSINEIVSLISKKLKIKNLKIILEKKRIRPLKSEVNKLISSTDLLKNKTKWKAKYDFSNGLDKTIDWFKENKKILKPDFYNV